MSKVIFLIQTPLPTDKAKAFGDVHILIESDIPSATNLTRFHDRVIEELDRVGFDPHDDYIAITGPIAHVSLGLLVIYAEYGTPLKYLLFDGRTNDYKAREFHYAERHRTVKSG